jgi:hypothetical protein
VTTPTLITEPGIYDGIPEDLYHSDPVPDGSISSTGVKDILSSPARFAYNQEHGRDPKKAWDIGKVFHALALGTGCDVAVLAFDDYKKQDAQKAKKAAYAAGQVPLLAREYAEVEAMFAAFRAAPVSRLLQPDGLPERSLFWQDDETGVWCRGRLDHSNGLTTVDLKTADDASPGGFAAACAKYGYHYQQVLYKRGIRALGLAGDLEPEFLFAAIETKPPYLSAVYDVPDDAIDVAEVRVSQALRRFAECQRTGYWPGYPTGITTLRFPRWALYLPEEDL